MDSMYVNQGTTEHILFDRGEFDQGLARLLGITWDLTSPYKPSSNSMIGCMHGTLQGRMRQFVSPEVNDQDTHLNLIHFAVNNA